MLIGSLFSGYGGLDLAVEEYTGGKLAWVCEVDEAPSRILEYHYPNVPNIGDVTAVNWSKVEPVDILTGGSPCQDLSNAGMRAGMSEGTNSNLWVNMRDAIDTLRPRLVIWENVRGALSAKATSESDMESEEGRVGDRLKALGRVLGDLTKIGYNAIWTTVHASYVGAPHQRARIFLVAWKDEGASYPLGFGLEEKQSGSFSGESPESWIDSGLLSFSEGGHNLASDFGEYKQAVWQWERVTRPAPSPVEINPDGDPWLTTEFAEWMMGLPDGWVTNPEIGLNRLQQLKAIGNGVVPQQAYAALHLLFSEVDKLSKENEND